jgi:hypothetical protein
MRGTHLPFSLRQASDPDITIATCNGSLGLEQAKAGAKAIWSNRAWLGRPIVWDFRLAHLTVSAAEVKTLAEFILSGQPAARPPRMAIVTSSDLDFGLARMFAAYREHPSTQVRVFRDYEEAIVWAQAAGGARSRQ